MASAPEVTEGVLALRWVNQNVIKDKDENFVISVPVKRKTSLSSYLGHIFAEVEGSNKIPVEDLLKPSLWADHFTGIEPLAAELLDESSNSIYLKFVRLFQNGVPLTREEYELPVDYFASFGTRHPTVPLSLVTTHCGSIFISICTHSVIGIPSNQEGNACAKGRTNSTPVQLEFDLDLDPTVLDLKKKIMVEVGFTPDFLFADSLILDFPEKMDSNFHDQKIRDLQNFEEIMIAQMSTPDTILIELKLPFLYNTSNLAPRCLDSLVLMVSSSMTPIALESLLQEVVVDILEPVLIECVQEQLFVISDEPTLASCGVTHGTRIAIELTTHDKGFYINQYNAVQLALSTTTALTLAGDHNPQDVEEFSVSSLPQNIMTTGFSADQSQNLQVETRYITGGYVGRKQKSSIIGKPKLKEPPSGNIFDRLKVFFRKSKQPKPCAELPQMTGKINKLYKGLNLQAACHNKKCFLGYKEARILAHWQRPVFELSKQEDAVYCIHCNSVLTINTAVFHKTQWKYYGQKVTSEQSTNQDGTQSGNPENAKGNEIVHPENEDSEFVSCDWQVADTEDAEAEFLLHNPHVTVADWKELVLLTRQLQKTKTRPVVEHYKIGLGVSVPLIFNVSFNFERFKDYRQ